MTSIAKRMSIGDVKTPNKAKEIATPKKAKTPAKGSGSKDELNLSNIKVDSSATKKDKKRTQEEISKPTPKKLKSNDSVNPSSQKSDLVKVFINFPKCSTQQLKKVVQKLVNEAAVVEDPKFMEVKLKSNAEENEKRLEALKNIKIKNKSLKLFGMNNSIDHQRRSVFVEGKNVTAEEMKEKYKAVSVKKKRNRYGVMFVLTFNSVADANKASKLSVVVDGKECPPLSLSYSSILRENKKSSKKTKGKKQKKAEEVKGEIKKVVVTEEDDDLEEDSDEEEDEDDDME